MTSSARWIRILGAVVVAGWCAAAPAHAETAPSESDSSYTIKGGKDRTDLKSLTVEGEDRVHVEIERPPLAMDLDPSKVAGLVTGDARDVLDRVAPDLTTSYYASTAG